MALHVYTFTPLFPPDLLATDQLLSRDLILVFASVQGNAGLHRFTRLFLGSHTATSDCTTTRRWGPQFHRKTLRGLGRGLLPVHLL